VIGDTASVELTVLAPLWRRWWFVALAAAALATAGFAVHRARVRHLVEVATIRARIAADLHDGVGANLSRIAILSDVVRQQAAVALPQALPALASIGDNARELIDDMSDAVWSIDPRLDNLQEVVVRARAMASDLFDGRRITWWLHAPENAAQIEMAAEQRRHLYLILKESLTNVVRHANASTVVVRLTAPNGRVCLDIEDDGVGLAGNRSPRSPSHGHGLENIRARAAALGGTVTIAPGPGGGGTRIVVDAPLRPPA
jgi:signal transduction histidine kinase